MAIKDVMRMKRERDLHVKKMRAMITATETRSEKKFTDEENRQYNELQIELDRRDSEIQLEERLQAAELGTENSSEGAFVGNPSRSSPASNETRTTSDRFVNKRFKKMFPDLTRSSDFESPEDFFDILTSGRFDERMNARAAQAGSGALGGFAVPVETAEILWDRSLEESIVRPRAQVWPMLSDKRIVPAFNSEDTSESIYGFVGEWIAELQDANVQDPKLRAITHVAKKLAIFSALSREIDADGLGFNTQLQIAMQKALGHFQDIAFISGNGVGRPQGILNSKCTIEIPRTVAGSVNFVDIATMFARLLPGSFKNAVWLVNQSALVKLILLKDDGGHLLWKPGEPLLGIPVIITEKVPRLGNRADITLADFSCYSIGNRAEIAVDVTNAFKWTADRMDIRAIIRLDGQPIFSQPIKNGLDPLDTVSPFVVLK